MATDRRQVHYRKPINRKSASGRSGAENTRAAENPQTVDDFRLASGRYSAERYRQTSGRSATETPGETGSRSVTETPGETGSRYTDETPNETSERYAADAPKQTGRRYANETPRQTRERPRTVTPRRASGRSIEMPKQAMRPSIAIPKQVYVVVAVIVVLLLALGIASAVTARPDSAASGSGVGPDDEQQLATNSAALTDAGHQSAGGSQAAADANHQPADESLAWSDSDFAVDPARTEWNYEGSGEKVVHLTIDDGPSEKTQQVLDILDRYNCKATFFVVGHNDAYFPMIAEAYKRGHTIGLHTYSHDYAQIYASPEAYFSDLDAIGKVVEEQIGYVPCFIRFPGGSSNEVSASYCPGIMSQLVGQVQERGYQYFDWNVSSGDGSDHTAEELTGYATEPTELENIMLLCHDSATKQTTVDALPAIIEHYQALGYTFKALDRDALVVHHGVNN